MREYTANCATLGVDYISYTPTRKGGVTESALNEAKYTSFEEV